ncbi:MAG: recombinase family protein [Phycisphaerae bacterium]|nr:recombinase family protein [Phycisphaerae bacterium]
MSAAATRPSSVRERGRGGPAAALPPIVRCAVYTRKSTEEGLNQEFNSLDAQRESALAFIASQKHAGWVCLPEKYDDGGFTGGNIERPALKRLMADIEAGAVDCVVVYKVDRLSRSLLDFSRIMELFERTGVSFVSVTQQFNTTHSMGRLTLNILLSFAQFEREIISERTRDKIAAARKRGKYALGKPVLGYDYAPAPAPFAGKRLVPNPQEAAIVREIFELYLEHKSLLKVAELASANGWATKGWTSSTGRAVGKRPFDKTTVSRLLRHPLYTGKVPHKGAVYDGEHEGIVEPEVFARVQAQLKLGSQFGGAIVRSTGSGEGSLLRGLVRCKACGCAMTPNSASRPASRNSGVSGGRVIYRYYVCSGAVKRGRATCPCPSLPAKDLESFVLEQVRGVVSCERATSVIVARATELANAAARDRLAERDRLRTEVASDDPRRAERARARLGALERAIAADEARELDQDEMVGALDAFDGVWSALSPAERQELIRALVAGVEFDAAGTSVTVTFREDVGGGGGIGAEGGGGEA